MVAKTASWVRPGYFDDAGGHVYRGAVEEEPEQVRLGLAA
jgi:hypothetical protein